VSAAPARTCVGCRRASGKDELLRVVRSPSGVVTLDRAGTAPGRGAYVHPEASCIERATGKGTLARALGTGVAPDELGRLRDELTQGAL
jgi:hypothetical protein